MMPAELVGLLQKILNLIKQLRLKNFIPTIVSVLIGYKFASSIETEISELLLLLVALTPFCAFFALQNDIIDYHDDKRDQRISPLTHNVFGLDDLKIFSYIFLTIGVIATTLTTNLVVYFANLLFITLCYIYNKSYIRNSRPILSIIILALVMGSIPFIAGLYISGKELNLASTIMAIGIFLYRCSISILKDYKDHIADAKSKKLTYLKKYGGRIVRKASLILSLVGYTLILVGLKLALGTNEWAIILTLLGVFAIYQFTLRVNLGVDKTDYAQNSQIFGKIYDLSLYFDLGVLLCFSIL